jgi:hypothetical protein
MDTGKVPFGTEVYLVIKNPLYKGRCPYCGHKNSGKVDKWLIVEGIYNNIRIDGENLLYYAEYENSKTGRYETALINNWYLGDIIDSDYHDEGYKPGDFDVYSKDIDVCEYRGEFDGIRAFHTEKEAKEYIKEFSEYI